MKLTQNAVLLLKDLIQIESFSKNEALTAQLIEKWFKNHNIPYNKRDNNIWAVNKNYDHKKPTLLLNSHHDTVFPNEAYTRDPFLLQMEQHYADYQH